MKKVDGVILHNDSGQEWYEVIYDHGSHRTAHIVPAVTLHWRAAEYGIDPNDAETLLDIALHELHIDTSSDNPEFLYNTDQNTARTRHLEKIEAIRKEAGITDPDGHLKKIHDRHRSLTSPAVHSILVGKVAEIRKGSSMPVAEHRREDSR